MEPLNSSSLGAMGSLLRKLDELLRAEERAKGLIGDLRIISTKMKKLSEVQSPPHTVKYWMNDARELSYDMEVCVDLFVHASQPEALPAKLAWIFSWHKEILGFAARVKEVNERCERYNLVDRYVLSSPARIVVNHHLPTLYEEPDPVSMEEATNKLLEWLMPKGHDEDDLKLKVVSVLGDEGVGKSTLVKRLWRLSEGKFDCQAFVQTAKKPDTRMILRSILSQVCPKEPLKACKVPKLIVDLREHLRYKRYFIVIDGLWDASVWHIIKRSFPAGNQRIITTTAVEKVAHVCCSYDSNSIVNVKCLCDGEAKKLFLDRAFGSQQGCPPQLNDVTDEITRKCGGFPLAIICTARIVASQPETEQRQQLDYVNKLLPNNLRTHSSSVEILNQVLKLCYNSLPHCLKTCLLYLSVYPESYLFLKEDLVKQWIAEDFICTPEGKDTREVAGSYFDELLCFGLIQRMDSSINSHKKGLSSYTVHPVVFDFITCNSMEDNFITIIDYSQSTVVLTEKVRRLSLQFGSAAYATTPESVELSQVRSLSFIGLLGCMPSVAEFKVIRVMILDVWSDDRDTKFSLAEICKLLQLRYLQVRCNVTVQLPHQMQCLKHLEILEINAGVEYVPSGIVHLSRLLHVRLGRKSSQTPNFCSADDGSSVPYPPVLLKSFELPPPICIFSRLPPWFHELHKLRILEIVVRKLTNSIDALEELPVLSRLSLYVCTPTEGIIFRKDTFPALEYFKFVCGVLLLGFEEESLPNLRKLKLVFNAHKGEQYSNMIVGISHLLSLEKVVGSIGLAPDAEGSDRIAVKAAFMGAIRQHPCRWRLEKVVRKVHRPVDQDWNLQQEDQSSNDVPPPLWKLAFRTPPELPIFRGSQIEDETGNPLEVILVDADTGSLAALPQPLWVELVLVLGDFPPDGGREDWSADEFQRAIVSRRWRLLTGDVGLIMRDGRATVGKLQFTDRISWVKFRIGARVVPGSYHGGRIVEAITEAFVVKKHGDVASQKKYPPVLGDPVWSLLEIHEDGSFHKKLRRNNIETVEDFLRMLTVKPDELRAILGDRMTDTKWEATTKHARSCDNPGNKVYAYSSAGGTIYVDSIFNLLKAEIGGTAEFSFDQLNSDRKMLVRQLILEAYEHPNNLVELEKRSNPLCLSHYEINLGDSVWVLKNIIKEGTFHTKLERNNIKTVQEFVRMLIVRPDDLRAILGHDMTDDMWEETTKHARTCDPGNKVYVYTAGGVTIYMNSVFNLVKVEISGTECPLQHLNWDQMILVLPLIMEAYEQRHHLHETNAVTFDGDDVRDNVALLRARFAEQSRAGTQSVINNMVPNPWVIQ